MDKLEKALEKAREQRKADESLLVTKNTPPPLVRSGKATIRENQLEQSRIIAYRTRSAQADLFRILRTQVLQAMSKSNFKTLAITSPNNGDGKTTVALNLAISIAMDLKQTVLLADIDLRKPDIHRLLGLNPAFGLTDYLLHDAPLPNCLLRLPFDRLTTLPAGKLVENSSETLGSPRMASLVQEMKSRYSDRLIIFDMPPILIQDDPIAFLPNVDAVLLVVRDGVTTANEIKRCLHALENTNVIGTVLNSSL